MVGLNPIPTEPSSPDWMKRFQLRLKDALNSALATTATIIGVEFPGVGRSLAEADAAAYANGQSLRILPGRYIIAANTTFQSHIIVDEGAQFYVNSGITLAFTGAFTYSGLQQVFFGPGIVLGIRKVYSEWFGASATANDNAPAINAALACITSAYGSIGGRQRLRFLGGASGNYAIKAPINIYPSSTANLCIEGAGTLFGTILNAQTGFSGPAAFILHGATSTSSLMDFEIGSFSITNSSGSAALIGLQIGDASANTNVSGVKQNKIHDLYVKGFALSLWIQRTRLIDFNRCGFWHDTFGATTNAGITFATTAATAPDLSFVGDLNFTNCQVVGSYTGGSASTGVTVSIPANSNAGIAGVKFKTCVFYHHDVSILIGADFNVNVEDFSWSSFCQFDGTLGYVFKLSTTANGTKTGILADFHIEGNYFQGVVNEVMNVVASSSVNNANTCRNIVLTGNWGGSIGGCVVESYKVSRLTIANNQFEEVASGSNAPFILYSVFGATVTGNMVASTTGLTNTSMINLLGASDYCTISGNSSCGTASTPVANTASGTHNSVANNV